MVEAGHEVLGAALRVSADLRAEVEGIDGLHVLEEELIHAEASHDLDRLQVLIDVSELGISGYQAADWLRDQQRIDVGLSDHRRILATLSMSDDRQTAARLYDALERLVSAAGGLPAPPPVALPDPRDLELETADLPRDAFFGPAESVPAKDVVGRIAAEQITPYPPGIPVVVPGQRINQAVVDYLLSGLRAGMVLPDPADPTLETFRVRRG
jgi:arginine/lysine/ornithine decarboxylase